jgi:hypothetical protein
MKAYQFDGCTTNLSVPAFAVDYNTGFASKVIAHEKLTGLVVMAKEPGQSRAPRPGHTVHPGHKIERFKNYMGRTVSRGCYQFIADLPVAG